MPAEWHGSNGYALRNGAKNNAQRGLVVVVCGVILIAEGARQKFMKYLETTRMSGRSRRVVQLLGMIGTIARGAVFALAGVLVIDAAVSHNAAESGGIDKALLTLRDQPFGEFLMLLALFPGSAKRREEPSRRSASLQFAGLATA